MPLPFAPVGAAPEKRNDGWFDFKWPWDTEPEASVTTSLPLMSPIAPAAPKSTSELLAGSAWTPAEGAALSTLSAVPELFGIAPAAGVENWRAEHPILDLTTTLLGSLIPYAGVELASTRIPAAARALEAATAGGLKAFGGTAAKNPIAAGALKEFLRYSPLELSRLGTNLTVGQEEMGDMFADVSVSTALTAGIGGLGGFLRAGGRAAEQGARLLNGENGLLPGVELRQALAPEARFAGDRDQAIFDLTQESLRYVPEKWQNPAVKQGDGRPSVLPGRYIHDTPGLAPADAQWLEGNLFKPNSPNASAETLAKQGFDVRQLHTDNKAWSLGDAASGEAVAQKAGYDSLQDLAAHLNYPRQVTVQGELGGRGSAAAQLGAVFKRAGDSGALVKINDDTWGMLEDGGAWTVYKRLSRGAEPPKPATGKRTPFQFGPQQVRQGDVWLVGQTDRLDRLAGDMHKVQQGTVERWARMREPWRPLASAAPQQAAMNLSMRLLPFEDWKALQGLNRAKGVAYLGQKFAARFKAEANLVDQATVRALAERTYNVFRPKLGQMQGDAEYGRYLGLLEDLQARAGDVAKSYAYGVPEVKGTAMQAMANKNVQMQDYKGFAPLVSKINVLDDAERQQFVLASIGQFPAKELAAMKASGEVSPRVIDALEHFRAVNEHFVGTEILPALDEAGLASEIRWLEGFTIPRLFKGDNFVRVVDEKGKPQWLANGRNGAEAQEMAARIIDEAKIDGKTWTAQEVESVAFSGIDNTESLDSLYKSVHEQMGQSVDAQAIVGRAVKKMMAAEQGRSTPGLPSRLTKKRTGLPGSPDVEHYSADDVMSAVTNHMQQLGKYAAVHAWRYRLGTPMAKWGSKAENRVAYEDLNRKALQSIGIEGQITKQLNKLLNPVLGGVLGAKSATRIANATNKLMANWNLFILNPSFAVLNMLSPLQQVAPWLSFMLHAPTEAQMAKMQMMPSWRSDGKINGSVGVMSVPKILGSAIKLAGKPTDDLKQLYTQALQDGTLGSHFHDEFIGASSAQASGIREAWGKGAVEGLTQLATGMATKSEQWSRLVAFNSAYVLGKDFFGLQGDALYRFMRKGTETTMYGYHVMDRSRVLTGPLGSTWGLFKNWQFHFIDNMIEYAGMGLKDGVWGPMLWQGASALAVGGLGATPLVLLADGLAKWNAEPGKASNSYMWLQENWGKDVGDGLYFGLPSLLGVSLQASSSVPGTDVTQDLEMMGNVVAWERAKAAFGAVGGAYDLWEGTGQNPLKDGNIRDKMLQAFAPRAVFRAFSAVEGDYVKSMSTGQPSVRDLPVSARLLHAIGFNPVDVENHYIVGETFYKTRETKRDVIQDLGEAFAQARMAGDVESMDLIMRRAMVSNVDMSSVLQSGNTRYRREMYGDHLSQYDKLEGSAAEQLLGR